MFPIKQIQLKINLFEKDFIMNTKILIDPKVNFQSYSEY